MQLESSTGVKEEREEETTSSPLPPTLPPLPSPPSSSSTAPCPIHESSESDIDASLATAIYEIGLRNASPKLIMSLMPRIDGLNNEHIKSHLQKIRIHSQRSRNEFQQYYKDNLSEYVSMDDAAVTSGSHTRSRFDSIVVDDCIGIVNQMTEEFKVTEQSILTMCETLWNY